MDPETEKAEGGFPENIPRDTESGGHDEVAKGIGEEVTKENGPGALTQNIGGQNEGSFAKREDKSADYPSRACPAKGGEDDHDQEESGIGGKAG